MAATCMAVCKGSRKKIRGIFISSCHLPVAVECDIVILSEPGPIPQAPVGQFCRHNLSPRGDGNPYQVSCYKDCHTTQLIPARGRKQKVTEPRWTRPARHNLSPRGDGNVSAPGDFRKMKGHNLSPRGDGNITKETEKPLCMDTTYPREGTETYFCFALLSLLSNLTQLIPARGRKRFDLLFFRHLYPTQLIPARGRKRCGASGGQAVCRDTTYPREGTET